MSDKKLNTKEIARLIATTLSDCTKEQLEEVLDHLKADYGIEPIVQEVQVAEVKAEEEKSEFNVILEDLGTGKMAIIKWWKTYASIPLMEAKDVITSSLPITLREGVSKEESEAMQKAIEEVGGKCSIV